MKTIAVVTGASSGIGAEFARQIDRQYRLDEIWLIARREGRLKELAAQLATKTVIFPMDLTQDKKSLHAALHAQKPCIKLLVNSAGIGRLGAFADVALEEHIQVIALNVTAVVELSSCCLQYMQPGSSIIQVASSAGFLPLPTFAVYSATKAFVLHFANALYAELKDKGIHVMALCPGAVATEFFTCAKAKTPKAAQPEQVVRKALIDLQKKKVISAYGFRNRAIITIARILPRRVLLWLVGRATKAF